MEDSKSFLAREWDNIYHSKDSKFVLVSNVEGYKYRSEGNHVVVINRTYPNSKEGIVSKKAREGNRGIFHQLSSDDKDEILELKKKTVP